MTAKRARATRREERGLRDGTGRRGQQKLSPLPLWHFSPSRPRSAGRAASSARSLSPYLPMTHRCRDKASDREPTRHSGEADRRLHHPSERAIAAASTSSAGALRGSDRGDAFVACGRGPVTVHVYMAFLLHHIGVASCRQKSREGVVRQGPGRSLVVVDECSIGC